MIDRHHRPLARRGPSPGPMYRIRPARRWPRPQLSELWASRDLLLVLGVRDIKLRYRQTALGVVWIVLQPLLAAAIFSFVFGRVARLPTGRVPYFLFAYSGMLLWNLFTGTVTRGSGSLVTNAALVSKIYFPRLSMPISALASNALDFLVSGTVFVLLMGTTSTPFAKGAQLAYLPLWIVLVVLLAISIGTLSGAVAVRYRDVVNILGLVLQLGLYISPVAYSSSVVPAHYRFLFFLNPMAGIITGFRWSLLGTAAPPFWQAGYAIAFVLLSAFASTVIFKRLERSFADVI